MKCPVCGKDNPSEARFCANCGAALVTPTEPAAPAAAVEYMGFWIRFGAALIDWGVLWLISIVLSFSVARSFRYGFGFISPFFFFPLPWLYYWLFTGLKGQTPGKMAVGIKVINASGSMPGLGTAALREIPGKIVSGIVVYLGFLWIIWDKQKQGWHDKIARTYVVRVASRR